MRRIDKLLIKVRRAYGSSGKEIGIVFVEYMDSGEHEGEWRVMAEISGGTPADTEKDGQQIIGYYPTEEDALKALETMKETYAPVGDYKRIEEDDPIFIDDIRAWKD